jgi:hypothetical protein
MGAGGFINQRSKSNYTQKSLMPLHSLAADLKGRCMLAFGTVVFYELILFIKLKGV